MTSYLEIMKLNKAMNFWSKISAIFLTYWGGETGYINARDLITGSELFQFNIIGILFLSITFLLGFLPYFLPAIPLWYYGFKKKT